MLTEDTPQERDDKAQVLATELRRFKIELRVYYFILLLFFAELEFLRN